jgi:hypothetical protein
MRDDEPRDDGARAQAEEQAWREIVDHYGERAELSADLVDGETEQVAGSRPEEHTFEPFHLELYDESFTPPPLPPPAHISPERRVAWVGLVASPLLLVLLNLLDYSLPGFVTGGLVVAFIASFGYLVATMAPRDPDDDGARV